jgi:hypothetical protein
LGRSGNRSIKPQLSTGPKYALSINGTWYSKMKQTILGLKTAFVQMNEIILD